MRYWHLKFVFVALALPLLSCGGGGGDGGGSPSPPSNNVIISGTVFDADLRDGTVRVYNWASGVKGALLGTTTTDSVGKYSVPVPSATTPILIEIVDGFYFEEASNTLVTLDASKGHRLAAIAALVEGSPLVAQVTGFTTMAVGLAEHLIESQSITAQNAALASSQQLSAWVGFNILSVPPLSASDPANATPLLTDGHRYGLLPASISELTKQIDEAAFRAPHSKWTSIEFYRIAYDDIREDGKLDGQGTAGALQIDNVAVDPDLYRVTVAERLLQFVLSSRNKTGLTFNDLLAYASAINLYTDKTFGNEPAGFDITDTDPIITNFIPPDGATISGSYNANAMVSDKFGLKLAQYFVDGMFVATAGTADNPVRSINTRNFNNGAHTIRMELTNILDNKTSVTHNITIQN